MKLVHVNNCPNCPVLGAEDIPGQEEFHFMALHFDIAKARKLVAKRAPVELPKSYAAQVHTWCRINEAHLDHIPNPSEPGILVRLPQKLGNLLIDGNHRAVRSARDGYAFTVRVVEANELVKCGCSPHVVKLMEKSGGAQ